MPDGADQAVGIALDAVEGPPEQRVGGALPVDVRGDHGVDSVAGTQQLGEPVLVDRLAEAHEAPAAPGADRRPAEVHRRNGSDV